MRRRVLIYFVENPQAEVAIRQLARELGAAPQPVYRELINLEGWGLLFSRKQGNQRVFRVNTKFPLYTPLTELLRRYQAEQQRTSTVVKSEKLEDVVRRLRKVPTPEALIPGLTAKRTKPRSYAEERLLNREKK